MKNKNLRKITLVTTNACNMQCLYCYETHKENKHMSLETAKKVIDHEMVRLPEGAEIKIEMIGGEPFLPKAFKVFEGVVEYVDRVYPSRNISYIVTTNGTLVHGEIQEFLQKNSSRIALSLRGCLKNKTCTNALDYVN